MFRKIVLPSLLVIVALFAISLGATTPVHGQLVGVVCIAAPPVTTTSGCPSTPANVAGGAAGPKFLVAINIQGPHALNEFRTFDKPDNTIINRWSQPNVETAQTGIAINLASFALSATSGNLTITAGSSKTSTVTVSSVLSGIGTVTLSSAVTPVKTNGPTATLGTLSGTLSNRVTSFTSLLTVSTVAATPGGNYNVTVTGGCPTSGF